MTDNHEPIRTLTLKVVSADVLRDLVQMALDHDLISESYAFEVLQEPITYSPDRPEGK
jgi:hypothetical protein